MTKILITGGAGFIGSNLSDKLIDLKHEVFVVDNLSTGNKKYLKSQVKFFKEDIRSDNFSALLKKIRPEYIYHLAAQSSISKSLAFPKEDIQVNILATQKLIDIANKIRVKKLIFASSAAVYGEVKKMPIVENTNIKPMSIYGVSKLSSEYLLNVNYLINNLPFTIFRYANVYGKRQNDSSEGGVIAIFIKNLLKNKKSIIFGSGNQTRDFIHVNDINDCNIRCLSSSLLGNYNIGTNTQISINDLYNTISKKMKKNLPIEYRKQQHDEVQKSSLSIGKISREIGWKPRLTISTGLDKTINYYESQHS